VHINCARKGGIILAPHIVQNFTARKNSPRVFRKIAEKLKLPCAERNWDAIAPDFHCAHIDVNVAKLINVLASLGRRATKECFDAGR
jgi:hypothetical protein